MIDYSSENKTTNDKPFPGKIAVITDHPLVNNDDYHGADRLVAKYGSDKIVHVTWPKEFMTENEKLHDTVAALAKDKDIKALIISQGLQGTNAAIDEFKKMRDDDVFIVISSLQEPILDSVRRANLLFDNNQPGMGTAIANQARKQGAKVFVHYTFPRHMEVKALAARRDAIRQTCTAEGILFLDFTVPDPTMEAGFNSARDFILEDVPKLIAQYGEDVAFFCTCCQLQTPLIQAVMDNHAIYPQPCCPSPFHGFPEALGINMEGRQADLGYVLGEASRIAEERNMTDRLSTWPVSASMMFTNAGAEYAIFWVNGEVPKNVIEREVLVKCMNDLVAEVVGEASNVYLTSFSANGKTYDNYKLVLMSYLDI